MDKHTGRPRLLRVGNTVAMLCPAGHVVSTARAADFAHSREEAQLGDPNFTVTCGGT